MGERMKESELKEYIKARISYELNNAQHEKGNRLLSNYTFFMMGVFVGAVITMMLLT